MSRQLVSLFSSVVVLLAVQAECLAAPKFQPFGVNFSPYIGKQDPNTGVVLKPTQVATRLNSIRGYSTWVRTYSTTHGMETAGALAHKAGFKVALQAWLGAENTTAGVTNNRQEITNLIAAANRGEADMLIIGSEVLLRGDLSESKLLGYVNEVRSSVPANIPITVNDIAGVLRAHPAIMAASDIVLANFYPYWEGVRIDYALSELDAAYHDLVAAAGGKEVYIGETGWPSCGNKVGAAEPTLKNAAFYFLAFNSWARMNNAKAFYFEAFDEAWKAQHEGPQGACWGIRNPGAAVKSGMANVYNNVTLPAGIVFREGQAKGGEPKIDITTIPGYGTNLGIQGVVQGVAPNQYGVAVYINVYGGWWTKPYFNAPMTKILGDGTFATNIVTGGSDAYAEQIAAFVVPLSYSPTLSSGGRSIPGDVYQQAVAYTIINRPSWFPTTVVGTTGIAPTTFSITRSFSTAATARDSVVVTGSVAIPSDLTLQGKSVRIDIGGATWDFAPFAAKKVSTTATGGNRQNSTGTLTLTYNTKKKNWNFSASLKRLTKGTEWDRAGLLNATVPAPGIPVYMWITLSINGEDYSQSAFKYYTATVNRSGVLR